MMDQTVLDRTDMDPKAAYDARVQRMRDVIALKEPDHVPVYLSWRFWQARHHGMTCEEAMYDADGLSAATKAQILEFEPDCYQLPHNQVVLGAPLETLGIKALKWPGHGVPNDVSYQYLDMEFMPASEYDEYLSDPTGFTLRKYLPRIADALEPLDVLPDFPAFYHTRVLNLARSFADPGVIKALQALAKAGEQMAEIGGKARGFAAEMAALGYPLFNVAGASAPFDQVADYMRGSKGAMLDMFRHKDKLLAAMEQAKKYIIASAVAAKGDKEDAHVFMPLHWGLDGFMSEEQFKTFYWPQLKDVMMALIEADMTPYIFWEGNCNSRLEIIGDMPAGKCIYKFESTDMKLAKDVLGDTICIQGNIPASLLITGTPDDMDAYCKDLFEGCKPGGGFILDGACGIPDESKYECVVAMVEACRKYGQY
ncbi:MAG: hypothetical protein HOB64_06445 [Rhodospirillaceae bacterium]|nr:hypothetical protein [Rhodospirillaceae bacterium]MBT5179374.1 hypothetical protein [Rhodospirillaceae bacterium]